MTKKQMKIWKKACDNAKKKRGYVPAELQMLPMMIGLYEDGAIDIGMNDDFTIIKSKENKDEM